MKFILIADCQDAPQTLAAAAGARSVAEFFPIAAVDNLFKIANPGLDNGRMLPAIFGPNSGAILKAARLHFLGAPGIQPGIVLPQGAAADCFITIGTKTYNLSFSNFEEWLILNQPIPANVADPISNTIKFLWNGAAPIGRCRVVYDALNLNPVYFNAEFVAQLTLEIEISSAVIP